MAKTHSTRIDFEKDEVAGLMQKIRDSGLKIKKGYPFYKICANSSEPEKELGEIENALCSYKEIKQSVVKWQKL